MRFFITGTCAYGPQNNKSDLDIVLMAEDSFQLQRYLILHNIEMWKTDAQRENPNYSGFYFKLNDWLVVNVIEVPDEITFKAWRRQTQRMRFADEIENRELRLATFTEGVQELIKEFSQFEMDKACGPQ